ncbi:hypothetical protein AVEN_182259-1 [Araneus ventricosus]|uniref:Tc1-like transposase DDE domain-containing protein n=1 Tax=Araneus ventricosus TaxID=182803 RepID=A0A4Y2TTE2_ARAVE|nr:hypothetical protein AVEN_182259-1 [Araneus ventricosus]
MERTCYLPSNVREIDHYGGGSLMVWAGIMLEGRTPLHVIERGTVTGMRYRDEILEPYVRHFRGAVGPEFILMDDNARPHRALLVDEFLESEDIRRTDWPARSPDLNPIEYVWDALGRAIATRNPPPDCHPGNEKSVAERVGPIAPGNDKLPYFKYEVTLQGLYIFTPVVTKVLAAVRTLDRFGISDRAGAAIVSAALQDVGIISESNVLNVVNRNKIRHGRTKARATLLSQSVIKDMTLTSLVYTSMGEKTGLYQWKTTEEKS